MQVAGLIFPVFDILNVATRFVTLFLVLCFPITLIIAWAFELTPDGIKTPNVADREFLSLVMARHWDHKDLRDNYATFGAELDELLENVESVLADK